MCCVVSMFGYEKARCRTENPRVGGSIPPLGTICLHPQFLSITSDFVPRWRMASENGTLSFSTCSGRSHSKPVSGERFSRLSGQENHLPCLSSIDRYGTNIG